MITAYIARHFDRIHDWLADLLVTLAERELAAQNRDMIAARRMAGL